MNVFLDTEFTDLVGIKRDPALISIGLVAADGREFYAELTDTWTKDICSDFTVATVLPLLHGGKCQMSETELAVRLKEWIEAFGEEVAPMSDAPYFDWHWLQEIFDTHGWPANLRKTCDSTSAFNEPAQQHRFNQGQEIYWKENPRRKHHALHDARSLRAGWSWV